MTMVYLHSLTIDIACYWIGEDEMLKFGCRPRRPWAADLQWLTGLQWLTTTFTVGLLVSCSEPSNELQWWAAGYSGDGGRLQW